MSGAPGGSATTDPRAALSRELRDFLIQLSIALHRYAMYPEGHPSLHPTVDHVLGLLAELLTTRDALSLGVARTQLVIEGVATHPGHPVLAELATRLHRHHLGGVTVRRGVTPSELHEVLRAVARDPDRSGRPMGLDPSYRETTWPHVRLYPLDYERLRFASDELLDEADAVRATGARAAQLWIGLARAALASGAPDLPDDGTVDDSQLEHAPPTVVARAINRHERDAAYDQVIVGYLLQIADELKGGQVPESAALRQRISDLVSSLDSRTLRQLLRMGGDVAQRRHFLLNAAEGLAADAVVDLLQAARTDRQTISHALLRMLQKLARHAGSGAGRRQATADLSVREQVAQLIRHWSLRDPNPDAYRVALDRMASASPALAASAPERFAAEPRRVIEMALEADAPGPAVERAADALVDRGELQWLLETLRSANAPQVDAAVRGRYVTTGQLTRVLAADSLNLTLLDELLPLLGATAADPLLDALIAAESSQARRALIDRLVRLGPAIGPAVVRRLDDERWYVTRNMLALLGELPALPPDFDPHAHTAHPDGRVRREALRILLRDPATRDRAICTGLGDTDDHAVRLALTAAARGCPESAIPLLARRATSGSNADQRTVAVRVLAATGHPTALDALLRLTAPRRTLFGRKPPLKSREYLAALGALARFRHDPRAREALAVAAGARDPEIARAAAAAIADDPAGAAEP